MGRKGSSPDWGESWESDGSRSGRGGPNDSGRRSAGRDDGRGRARLSTSQVTTALREAQQLQQDGHIDDAIQLCEELMEGGVSRADVHYFLGWLYQEADRWDDAAAQFELLLNDGDYALSCYYALGQCARAQGNIEDAAHYFDEAVDRVNLDALTRDESDQLLQLCQEAAEAHREMNDLEGAETVYMALLGFLRSQGWLDQVAEIERQMRETLGTEPPQPRRRRNTSGVRAAGAIPARARGADGSAAANPRRTGATPPPPASSQMPATPPPLASSTPMPVATSSAHLSAAVPPAIADITPLPGNTGMAASYGGFGAAASPQDFYAAPAGTGQGDELAQLIHGLGSGMSGVRTGMATLPEPQRAQVSQAVREIENYVAHGLLTAAIEECLRVIEVAPQYFDVHLMLGEIYVRQGKIEQAIAKYAILIDTYLVNGRVDDAISTYRRILQLEPNNLTYRVKLIELLNRQGRSDEVLNERMSAAESYLRLGYADRAIQEYEQALLSNPNNMQLRLSYALALLQAGRLAPAIGEYQRVLQVDSANINALTHMQIALASSVAAALAPGAQGGGSQRVAGLEVLGRLLRGLRGETVRTHDEVIREYIQALELSPSNPDLRFALGQIQLAGGHQQEAIACFQHVVAISGFEVLAHYATAQAYLMTGDPINASHAVRELEEAAAAVRRVPPDPTIWAARPRLDGESHHAPDIEISDLLGRAYQLSGQAAQGQARPAATNQPRPYNDEVYHAMAEISARQGDTAAMVQEYGQLARHYRTNRQVEHAVAVLKEMARLSPDEPAVHSELADIHVTRGLLDEGLSELGQLADVHVRRGHLKDAALVYQRMAEINWGMGNRNEALALLRQAMQNASDDMSLRQQFVQYCLEMGKGPEAVEQQTVLARTYFSSRQTKEAVAALQQLIGMDPHNKDAYDLLGQTYYSVGEYEQAARVYRNLAKVDPNNAMARTRLQELQAVRAQMR